MVLQSCKLSSFLAEKSRVENTSISCVETLTVERVDLNQQDSSPLTKMQDTQFTLMVGHFYILRVEDINITISEAHLEVLQRPSY